MLWEYLCLDLDWKKDPTPLLKKYGMGGWELVAALPAVPAVGSRWQHRYLMKKPLLTEPR